MADQRCRQQVTIELARRGCWVVLSNSTAPEEVAELYDGHAAVRAAGLVAYDVSARRAINSDFAGRSEILEYLISNVPQRGDRGRYCLAW